MAKAKPFVKGGNERDRAIQSKGGKASGAARRERRDMRAWARIYMEVKGKDGKTLGEKIIKKMFEEGIEGSVHATEFLAKLMGEMAERIEMAEVPKLIDDI